MTATDAEIRSLNDLRHALLALHKTLLDTQRIWYEREHGRVEGGNQLLQVVAFDPAFSWLRLLSAMIVQIDEKLDDKKNPVTAADAKQILSEARTLLLENEGGEFKKNFERAIQEQPDVVIAQTRVARLLGR